MRRFLAVSGLFVAINLVAAGTFWALGKAALLVIHDAGDLVWPYAIAGLAALAAAMLCAKWGIALTGKWLARSRGDARG